MAKNNPTIILRGTARAQGLTLYFTGKPCKHGHISERQTSNGVCRACSVDISRKYRDKPEVKKRKLVINKLYRDEHPGWKSEQDRKCYIKHRARRLAGAAAYHKANPEIGRKSQSKWRKNNPHKLKVFKASRRAREAAAVGSHSPHDILEIFKMQGGKCGCCKKALGSKYHLDHITPLSRGGSNFRTNLQLLCQPCNNSKSGRDPIEFMRSRGMLL